VWCKKRWKEKEKKRGRGVCVCGVKKKVGFTCGGEKVRGKRKKENHGVEKKRYISFICLLGLKCRIVKIC
jgi:hypothetical protein